MTKSKVDKKRKHKNDSAMRTSVNLKSLTMNTHKRLEKFIRGAKVDVIFQEKTDFGINPDEVQVMGIVFCISYQEKLYNIWKYTPPPGAPSDIADPTEKIGMAGHDHYVDRLEKAIENIDNEDITAVRADQDKGHGLRVSG